MIVLLLLISCFCSDLGLPRILNVGHRGDPTHAPENTMLSFQMALKYGADGFETDLRLTTDEVIVLSHNDDISKTTNCTGLVSKMSYADLKDCDAGQGQKVPTFQEAAEFAKENHMFIVMDLKVDGLGRYIPKVLLPLEMEGSCIASCWRADQVADISKYSNVTIKQHLGYYPAKYDEAYFREMLSSGVSAFSLQSDVLDSIPQDFIRLAHEHAMPIFAWTINDILDMFILTDRGIDGVITNNPDVLKVYLDELQELMFNEGPPSFSSLIDYSKKKEMKKQSYPIVIAHRGDQEHAPENTLSAFKLAALNGANGFETDLHLTKDGYIVLIHDPTLDRTTNCSGQVSDWNLKDILSQCDAGSWFGKEYEGERIPTFEQAVQLAKEYDVFIVMDMKMDGLVPKIVEIVNPLDMQTRVVASCRNVGQVRNVQKLMKDGTVIQQLSNAPDKYDEEWWIQELETGYKSFSYNFNSQLSPSFVRDAHKHMIYVVSWVSNDPQHMFDGFRYGHDAIMTNDPVSLNNLINDVRGRVFPSRK